MINPKPSWFYHAAIIMGGVVLSMGASSSSAQECQTFENTLRSAAEMAPSVSGAKAELESAAADMMIANSLTRPQLSAFAQSATGEQGLVASDFNNQVGLRASQRLFDFGDASLARQAAKEGRYASEYQINQEKERASLQVALLYIDWLEAFEELDVTSERVTYFQRETNALEAALSLGGATRAEVAELAAELSLAEMSRLQIELKLENAQSAISVLTNDPSPACRQSLDSFFSFRADPASDAFQVEDALQLAVQNNPILKTLESRARQSDSVAKRQSKERLPIIELVGIASVSENQFGSGTDPNYRLGVDVSVPILSGSALRGRSRGALADASRSRAEVDIAHQQLERDLRDSVLNVIYLEAQSTQLEQTAIHRRAQFEAMENEYQLGVATLPRLVDARIDLERDLLSLVHARYDLYRARLNFLSKIGGLSEG